MRPILQLLLFILPSLALSQSDTYGKTEAQILAMGEEKWDDFYQSKAGNSTAAMVEMNVIFGAAAEHRNVRLTKAARPSVRARVEKLRKLMEAYGADAVGLGYNVTGGGTMWAQVSADITAHTELVLFGVLGGKSPAVKHATVSDVNRQLEALAKTIEGAHTDKDNDPNFKYGDAGASISKMRAELSQIAMVAKPLSRANSDRVLRFCIDYAKTADGDWG